MHVQQGFKAAISTCQADSSNAKIRIQRWKKEDNRMQSTRKNQDAIKAPKPVKAKIASFVRYGDEIVAITQLGTGIWHNFKSNSTQTF